MNDGRICVSVCSETAADIVEKIGAAQEFADIVEVRFDCLPSEEIDPVLSAVVNGESGKPVLITFRAQDQGGNRELKFEERLSFWAKVLSNTPADAVIDIEADPELAMAVRADHIPRIVSYHDFGGIPTDLSDCFDAIATAFEADIVKIAVTAEDITDTIEVWKLLERAKNAGKQVIPIAMGEAGKWTRILGLAHGAFLTYTSLDAVAETAPGQVTARQMAVLYRARELDLDTRVFGILGDPVSHSLSPFLHNPAFVSEGINGVFVPFLVKDIELFMRRMVRPQTREIELNFGGFSVTMPHKQSIMKHLDEIDPTAAKIGAVNTVKIRENGTLVGYNTDALGFITPLRKLYGELNAAKAAVCGAGGASRACIHALQQEGCDVELFVRDVPKARPIGEEFGVPVRKIDDLRIGERGNFDILVDTTPTGMFGTLENETLFTADELSGIRFVYDLVTKPYDTPIVREAKRAGIPAIGGVEMLLAQGAEQFRIWTGKDAPVDIMRRSLNKRFEELDQ